jgi:small subunit ribosomal protein S29
MNLVNSTTTYAYDIRTQTYFQPAFASQTLQRVLTANPVALSSLQTQEELSLERKAAVPAGTSLADLIHLGLKDPSISPIILDRLLEELGKQTS